MIILASGHYATWSIVLAFCAVPASMEMLFFPNYKSLRFIFILMVTPRDQKSMH